MTVTGDCTVLARERWLGGEGADGSYLAKDFEDSGEGLFFVELVDTVLDIIGIQLACESCGCCVETNVDVFGMGRRSGEMRVRAFVSAHRCKLSLTPRQIPLLPLVLGVRVSCLRRDDRCM